MRQWLSSTITMSLPLSRFRQCPFGNTSVEKKPSWLFVDFCYVISISGYAQVPAVVHAQVVIIVIVIIGSQNANETRKA
jgi:hypothetical protein